MNTNKKSDSRRARILSLIKYAAAGIFIIITGIFALGDKKSADINKNVGQVTSVDFEDFQTEASETTRDESKDVADIKLSIYVCGAVQNAGVYTLNQGSRIDDALKAAGGALEDADLRYINLAAQLQDAQQITVYTFEETKVMGQDDRNITGAYSGDTEQKSNFNNASKSYSDKININSAGEGELTNLPGIGSARAKAIIEYRNAHGGFSKAEEIMNVSGIKQASYEKIKDLITI